MPLQLPALSSKEQSQLLDNLTLSQCLPVLFIIQDSANHFTSLATPTFNVFYKTFSYTAPSLSGLLAGRSLLGNNREATSVRVNVGWQLSYQSTPQLLDASNVTRPTDAGNIVDQVTMRVGKTTSLSVRSQSTFKKFQPGVYPLHTNETIYLHFMIINPDSLGVVFSGSYQLYIQQTGMQL